MNAAAPISLVTDADRGIGTELRPDGILVNAICPGWVAADMGGPAGGPVVTGAASVGNSSADQASQHVGLELLQFLRRDRLPVLAQVPHHRQRRQPGPPRLDQIADPSHAPRKFQKFRSYVTPR
ncbi:hypothetical protein [Streptomyces violaceusniger]|uniref:hypothetical protein n=1 Tax=Streptomyces violaceusniger TaxID=68280 RepID=UPI0001E4CA69